MSWDGFSLLDAKLLHDRNQVSSETPAHLAQLQAYIYSWLLGALPLDSADMEFLLHGLVGLLVQVYVEQLFGSADAASRLQKMTDTVIEMDKAGRGGALSQQFPVPTNRFGTEWRAYVRAKSTILFSLLETRMGGRDAMRLAIQALLHSPSLHDKSEENAAAKVAQRLTSPLTSPRELRNGEIPRNQLLAIPDLSTQFKNVPGLSYQSFFAILTSCASSALDSEAFVRQ